MKKAMTTAMMAALLASSALAAAQPALAQSWQDNQAKKQAQAQAQAQAQVQSQPQAPPQVQAQQPRDRTPPPQGRAAAPQQRPQQAPQQRLQQAPQQTAPQQQYRRGPDGRTYRGPTQGAPQGTQGYSGPRNNGSVARNNGAGPGYRSGQPYTQYRGDRDRGRPSYDPRYYPRAVNARQRFQWRGRPYRYQPGFYFRRWYFGDVLPWGWYSPDYYIDDWYDYGLTPPPAGFEWVRVGNDAILIDVFTGQVFETVYGLFW